MGYLVSVVVPTKNRYKYLKYLIKLIDGFNLSELELVIQDNSDDNSEIVEYLNNFNNTNIKYYYSSAILTMSQNGEKAILNAEGEYVCYIGDDDGVCRNIVDCVKWMKSEGIEAAYNTNVWFMWGRAAKLHKPCHGMIIHSTGEELNRLVKKGCNLMESKLPLLYHGIVKKDLITTIKDKYGTLFPSVPPDISGSICLASVMQKCCELRTPVIINGISQMAGGGVIRQGGVLELEDVSFITQQDIIDWETNLPPLWCGYYAWANSALKTFKFINQIRLADAFNVDYCLAQAVSARPHKKVLWEYGLKYANNKIKFIVLCFTGIVMKYLNKIWRNRPWAVKKMNGVMNIIDAESFFMKGVACFNYPKE